MGPDLQRRGRVLAVALVAAAGIAGATIWAASGGGDEPQIVTGDAAGGSTTTAAQDVDAEQAADRGGGTIRVRLEPVTGYFIEGFEVGLRFEQEDGTVIASTLWSDFIATTDATEMDDYYRSVFEQPVPAGTIRVRGEANIGPGGPPAVPDLDGEMRCTLDVNVMPATTVTVEVRFVETSDCLHEIDGTTTPAPTLPSLPSTTVPEGDPYAVGTSHFVDVDLQCSAFELNGTWVMIDGNLAQFQQPGERHAGGMLTIQPEGRGHYVGDALGQSQATFRQLGPGESPPCAPVPR